MIWSEKNEKRFESALFSPHQEKRLFFNVKARLHDDG